MSKFKIILYLLIVLSSLILPQSPEYLTINGHKEDITHISFSTDDKLMATSSKDSSACIWNIQDGKLIGKFSGHAGPVYGSAFSTDNKYLITCSGDLTVRVWEISSYKNIFTSKPFNDDVKLVAVSPNNKYFAAEDDDEIIKVWDFNTFQMIDSFPQTSASYYKNIFFKTDEKLVYWSGSSFERNISSKTINYFDSGQPPPKYSVTVSEWKKGIFEIKNNFTKNTTKIDNKGRTITSYDLQSDYFVFGDEDGKVELTNLITGNKTSYVNSDKIRSVQVSKSGRFVVSFDQDDFVKLYDNNSGFKVVRNDFGSISNVWYYLFSYFSDDEKFFHYLSSSSGFYIFSTNDFSTVLSAAMEKGMHSNSGKYMIAKSGTGVTVINLISPRFEYYHNFDKNFDWLVKTQNEYFLAAVYDNEVVILDLRQIIPDDILPPQRDKFFDLSKDITEFETEDDYQNRMKKAKLLGDEIRSWYRVKEEVAIDSIGKFNLKTNELPLFAKGENVVINIQKEAAKTFKDNYQKIKGFAFKGLTDDLKAFRYTDFSFPHPVDGTLYVGQSSGNSTQPPVIADIPENKKTEEEKNVSPEISLIQPKIEQGGAIEIKEPSFAIIGEVSRTISIKELKVNDQKVKLDKNFQFHANLTLPKGNNKVVITAITTDNKIITFDFIASYKGDITPPVIAITDPPGARGMKIIRKTETVKVKGTASDESGVASVTINDKPAKLNANGSFEIDLYIEVGDNTVKVEAVDKVGNKAVENLIITRQLEDLIAAGKYYALIIGINEYKGSWSKLRNAVNDASSIAKLLKSDYRFDQVLTLFDAEATRAKIISEFERLSKVITPDDNLIIFYSGHGEFKAEFNKGYWVPVDATTNSVAGYISNNDLQTFIAGIKSKHTLLITDACFAGDIFKGSTKQMEFENTEKYFKEVYRKPSRYALTSGDIEPVTDGGTEGHSIFTYFLLKKLTENKSKYFTAFQLFQEIEIPVINSSDQQPKYLPIKNAFDEGGQFIFIRRE